jgi:hypothetical protein
MTWSQFFQAMRKGIGDRTAAATRRGASASQQQQARSTGGTRSASTQAGHSAKQQIKQGPIESWDLYIIDVSEAWG